MAAALGGVTLHNAKRDQIMAGRVLSKPAQPAQSSSNTMFNPQVLNVAPPASKRNHFGQSIAIQPSDVTGIILKIDGGDEISLAFTPGQPYFSLVGLTQYQALLPGPHYLQVAVVTKTGRGAFTPSTTFSIGDDIPAPEISFS